MIGSSICLMLGRIRKFVRIIDLDHLAAGRCHAIADARRGRDQIDIEFALQPLLDDLQMQQPEKSAAESEAERDRIFRLEVERAVVQPKFFKRIAQQPVLVRFHRIEPGEHHRLDFLESGQRLRRRVRRHR